MPWVELSYAPWNGFRGGAILVPHLFSVWVNFHFSTCCMAVVKKIRHPLSSKLKLGLLPDLFSSVFTMGLCIKYINTKLWVCTPRKYEMLTVKNWISQNEAATVNISCPFFINRVALQSREIVHSIASVRPTVCPPLSEPFVCDCNLGFLQIISIAGWPTSKKRLIKEV